MSQRIAIEPKTRYVAQFYIKGEHTNEIEIKIKTENGNSIGSSSLEALGIGNSKWISVVGQFQTDAENQGTALKNLNKFMKNNFITHCVGGIEHFMFL